MKITGDWINAPATQSVCRMLTGAGHQALFVGGCVRNALFDVPVNDIDLATDAVPARVLELAQAAGLNAVPTGIDHGTVTVIADHVPHEITTFRKDVETDGRRAVVAFSTDVSDDAHRRDFTMNALYARPDGEVVDPLGGMVDLINRRVRFIDDADLRIREDYLRILRYFRFHAWYGDAEAGMDAQALAAIAANIDGLGGLSRERIGHEMRRLLGAPDPAPAVAAMRSTGALGAVLPGTDDRALALLVHLEPELCLDPDPIRRLATLGGDGLTARLRLSRKEARHLAELRAAAANTDSAAALGYRLGVHPALSALALRSALLETPLPPDAAAQVHIGARAVFPLTPADLMPDHTGPALGVALKRLESDWVASGFTLSRDDLLSRRR
ncbi:CCA tRNA nucleotidyltransferase [Thiosulfatihalobacter marinus]|uniref:CCA tRNA nucleotidyltransferase n=1 Tax=Thiosulfatihalobacter marinus TaxID=2792481 RepID=UPI0018D9851F|nr:CCA tRNA nucleotidyltransferase [Thiosulfatihalobacter marinus]